MLPTTDEIQSMTTDEKEAHILANTGRAFGLVEASALHDPEHAEQYRERFDSMVTALENDWDKLSPATQRALETATAETRQGMFQAELVNVVADLLGPPIEL